MKYSAIEIAGMLQDNQDTISKLKQEVEKYKALANPKPKLSNIERRFQEDAINAMYDEQNDYHTGF
jgi:hypothetical protein|tara:strand:- start:245 stop:442 length:198 start_codon:yes stop_codon:yes gene_type:complete